MCKLNEKIEYTHTIKLHSIKFGYVCPKCFDHIRCFIPPMNANFKFYDSENSLISPKVSEGSIVFNVNKENPNFVFSLSDVFHPICKHCDVEMFHCDDEIVHIISSLNKLGFYTKFSCAGHNMNSAPYIMFDNNRMSDKHKKFIKDFINQYRNKYIVISPYSAYIITADHDYVLDYEDYTKKYNFTVRMDLSDLYKHFTSDEVREAVFKQAKHEFIQLFLNMIDTLQKDIQLLNDYEEENGNERD